MADQDSRKTPSIPAWQQNYKLSAKGESSQSGDQPSPDQSTPQPSAVSELPLLEQAQKLLKDESIREAPRERKIEFLQKKGLQADDIEKLLGPEHLSSSASVDDTSELKTIHDSSLTPGEKEQEMKAASIPPAQETLQQATVAPKRDIPPIITYPEFLLKPQKPPPLVTFERLANAAYALAGISALTWGASKYIVQPMLESLTEARHDLAETAKSDLETLNTKLESTVSHVPYIPSLSVLQHQKAQSHERDNDLESEDSDPTELFHRDIATQTSPTVHGQYRLKQSMADFQAVLDKLEASYNPFQIDYTNSFSSYSGPGSNAATGGTDKSKNKQAENNEAMKFKNEIRSLKGAFLSSRNFPTARPAQPFTLPTR